MECVVLHVGYTPSSEKSYIEDNSRVTTSEKEKETSRLRLGGSVRNYNVGRCIFCTDIKLAEEREVATKVERNCRDKTRLRNRDTLLTFCNI
jgi:hypothetical protein